MLGYNKQGIKLLPYRPNAPIPSYAYGKKYTLYTKPEVDRAWPTVAPLNNAAAGGPFLCLIFLN